MSKSIRGKQATFYLYQKDIDLIKETAEEQGCPDSEVIRRAIVALNIVYENDKLLAKLMRRMSA